MKYCWPGDHPWPWPLTPGAISRAKQRIIRLIQAQSSYSGNAQGSKNQLIRELVRPKYIIEVSFKWAEIFHKQAYTQCEAMWSLPCNCHDDCAGHILTLVSAWCLVSPSAICPVQTSHGILPDHPLSLAING